MKKKKIIRKIILLNRISLNIKIKKIFFVKNRYILASSNCDLNETLNTSIITNSTKSLKIKKNDEIDFTNYFLMENPLKSL